MNNKVCVSYAKACKIVRAHRIHRTREYHRMADVMRRLRLPAHPEKYYKEWKGWDHFLLPAKKHSFHRLKRKKMPVAA